MNLSKWTDITAEEEMQSNQALPLISYAVGCVEAECGPQGSVLSIGCGDGTELKLWKDAEVVGFDLNDTSLEKCRAQGLTVEKMDMHDLKIPDNTFDLVFMRDVFEHSVAHIQSLSEATRVSKRYVVIVLPDETWSTSPIHFIIPNLKQMISLAMKVGLQLKAFKEYNLNSGNICIGQSIYILEKHQ